jgi:hypothetical protein
MDKKDLFESGSCSTCHTKIRNIIMLEKDKNEKGDLFNRLVSDVLHALGFGEPRYNVPMAGREIDMVLQHRTEKRFALVESKAQKEKVGGTDINKFVGALDVERGKYGRDGNSVVGYFIARSGFTAAAREQENERSAVRKERGENSELILLGPSDITRELIQGNVICSLEKAVSAVKQPSNGALSLCEKVDLIACEQGWIWVLYYAHLPRQTATHFAFVHADGNQLLNNIAEILIKKARSQNIAFSKLLYLASTSDAKLDKQAAQYAYFRYLENELGEIQFEGMPTGKLDDAVKVNLENIFVPLRFEYNDTLISGNEFQDGQISQYKQISIAKVLNRTSRAAILAKPGGGKSTLIRRIALAYAFPERRIKVDDGLPDCNWFPVYIRCRDLGDEATKSIFEIIGSIVHRTETINNKRPFEVLVEDALQDGRVLLLIDGLDEISNEKNRICFVNQLRTFVATYPTIHLIITSREAGFRVVAGTLASYCEQYSIANFRTKEIRNLSLKWHKAILGESAQAKAESNKVCDIILHDQRMITLAGNPLLLTTLLFVKRCVGYLPTKKRQLYEEMIKLLLVTWNSLAHDKLDMDETEPQLAYVAYYMTTRGQQKITKDKLTKSITESRKLLPELLDYTELSPSKFIDQVEERSSLLIQMGLEEDEKGQWAPSYEFSHLSFQEYLTAKAIVNGWISNSDNYDPLDTLIQHIGEDHWIEVIPLVAVLLGRDAKPLIERLIELSAKDEIFDDVIAIEELNKLENVAPVHLANCVASEVPMNQDLLERAIRLIVKRKITIDARAKLRINSPALINVFETILKSKYGGNYQEVIKKTLFEPYADTYTPYCANTWEELCRIQKEGEYNLREIIQLLTNKNHKEQATGTLRLMHFAFKLYQETRRNPEAKLQKPDRDTSINLFSAVIQLLQTNDLLSIYSATWCIAWSGYAAADIIPHEFLPSIAKRLAELWVCADFPYNFTRMISWGLGCICMSDLSQENFHDVNGLTEAIENYYISPRNQYDCNTAIHLAIFTDHWTKKEIQERISMNESKLRFSRFIKESGFNYKKTK